MTRAQQNTLIINSLTDKLKDLPNVQTVITTVFNAWFRELVKQGQQLTQQGQQLLQQQGGGQQQQGGGEQQPVPEGGQ